MSNIVIVECASTGINYIQDIIDRNHTPIVLETRRFDDSPESREYYEKVVKSSYELINNEFELIHEKESYEETLEMVREYDPLLVIPGSEKGVILATKLANDLNLLCNPIEILDAITLKDEMHNKLAENNVRHIKGQVVSSVEEAIEFYEKEGFEKVVVKPLYSAASVGVRICSNKEEMIRSLEEVMKLKGLYGNDLEEVLIQECIDGNEYIVNTVSCNGTHRVTTIWKYHKITTSEGGQIYDYEVTVNELGIGEAELIEYAYDTLDALGIKYGPVHGEYMIDEKGPVLIEVNCRPSGASMDAEFLHMFSGQHETDSALDSYLNPEKFHFELKKEYKFTKYAALKSFIVPKDLIAKSSPMGHISKKLKSHYKTSMSPINEIQHFKKTEDMETSGGNVYLVHENPYQVQKDITFLRNVERNAFRLVLSEELDKKAKPVKEESFKEIRSFMKDINVFGTCLLITDTLYEDLDGLQVYPQKLNEVNGKFDVVVLNLNKSFARNKDIVIAEFILNSFEKVNEGGLIVIPKSTYDTIPNGRLGAEALVKSLDLKIQLPLHNFPKMIMASKR